MVSACGVLSLQQRARMVVHLGCVGWVVGRVGGEHHEGEDEHADVLTGALLYGVEGFIE